MLWWDQCFLNQLFFFGFIGFILFFFLLCFVLFYNICFFGEKLFNSSTKVIENILLIELSPPINQRSSKFYQKFWKLLCRNNTLRQKSRFLIHREIVLLSSNLYSDYLDRKHSDIHFPQTTFQAHVTWKCFRNIKSCFRWLFNKTFLYEKATFILVVSMFLFQILVQTNYRREWKIL